MMFRRSDIPIQFRPVAMVLTCLVLCLLFQHTTAGYAGNSGKKEKTPRIMEVVKIWDFAPHNAFTGLVRYKGRWFCTFREGERHVYGKDGAIRIISSKDGRKWEAYALLEEKGIDLRDPKLSVTPGGRLMLNAGGSEYRDKVLVKRRPRVSFSRDGRNWSGLTPILKDGDWLWRVTWNKGVAWGTSYVNAGDDWSLKLYKSTDGVNYEVVTTLQVDGRPNETTLRFLSTGEMVALVRRESGTRKAWTGCSMPPYTGWKWKESDYQVGGPDFVVISDKEIWGAGRKYGEKNTTTLARMDKENYQPVMDLPSGGDSSYPGLVWYRKTLWMSYYSSHEGKASIYLAKIKL